MHPSKTEKFKVTKVALSLPPWSPALEGRIVALLEVLQCPHHIPKALTEEVSQVPPFGPENGVNLYCEAARGLTP